MVHNVAPVVHNTAAVVHNTAPVVHIIAHVVHNAPHNFCLIPYKTVHFQVDCSWAQPQSNYNYGSNSIGGGFAHCGA